MAEIWNGRDVLCAGAGGGNVTVYVDAYRRPATVSRITGRWSHLIADTRPELHMFAEALGLDHSWFQDDPIRWHYDVTEPVRRRSVAMGATEISLQEVGQIMRLRHRFIVTASRTWTNREVMREVLSVYRGRGLVLVHGAAGGGDQMTARIWRVWEEKDEPHPADWGGPCRDTCRPGHRKVGPRGEHCPAAGMYRNAEMVSGGGVALVAFVMDRSAGATSCVRLAEAAGIMVDRTDLSGPLPEREAELR
jgi:hypothetical protein